GSEHVRAPRLTIIGEERERIEKIILDGIQNRPKI
ncbi:MAG TPA: dihydrodipicolinate synthase family protein, partial [Algoriphagus sp.]|nr:dihydrodipicolinate synthase family protein [Algoriphagus sp.]